MIPENVEVKHYHMNDNCIQKLKTNNDCKICIKKDEKYLRSVLQCPWEWIQYWDKETNVNYWYNPATEEVSETKPEWIQYWDEEVKARYWYNPVTGEATWIKPEDMNTNSEFEFKQPEEYENNKITGGKNKKSNKRMNKKQLKKLAVKALKTKKVQNHINRKICNIFSGDAKKACTTEFDKSFIKSFISTCQSFPRLCAYQKANASKKKISGRNQKHKTIKRRSKK
jgi:hypothetical protein